MGLGWLRFLLSLMVLDQHLGGFRNHVLPGLVSLFGIQHLSPIGEGAVAVSGFFVLSGYLIAHVLDGRFQSLDASGNRRIAVGAFYLSRFLRIFPVYWLILFATAIAFAVLGLQGGYRGVVNELENALLFGYGFRYLGFVNEPLGGFGLSTHLIMPQVWTVTLDVVFYLAAPFVLLHAFSRRVMLVLGVIACLLFAWRAHTVPAWFISFYSFGWVYWVAFLLGAETRLSGWRFGPAWAGLVSVVLVMAAWLPLGQAPVLWQLLTLPAFAVLISFLGARKETPPLDRFLGELTYAIYLLQLPVLNALQQLHVPRYALWTVVLTLILAVFVSVGIERPLDRFRRHAEAWAKNSWRSDARRFALPVAAFMILPLTIFTARHAFAWSAPRQVICSPGDVCRYQMPPQVAAVVVNAPLPIEIPALHLKLAACDGKSSGQDGILCVPGKRAVLGMFRLPGQVLVGIDSIWVRSIPARRIDGVALNFKGRAWHQILETPSYRRTP